LNVGIVGCGLIGQKRAASSGNNILKAVADVSLDRAEKLACCYKDVKAFSDWKDLVELDNIDKQLKKNYQKRDDALVKHDSDTLAETTKQFIALMDQTNEVVFHYDRDPREIKGMILP